MVCSHETRRQQPKNGNTLPYFKSFEYHLINDYMEWIAHISNEGTIFIFIDTGLDDDGEEVFIPGRKKRFSSSVRRPPRLYATHGFPNTA